MTDDHKEYLEQVKYDYGQCDDQIREASEDFRFAIQPGGQWDKWMERSYENRAKMEFDFVTESHTNFMAEWEDNRVEVKYSPDDDMTNDDDAQILQGKYRHDFRSGNGRIAKDNAVYEASLCGYGAYELCAEYVDEESADDDQQRVAFKQITNAHTCLIWESGAKLLDKADANHVNIIEEFDKRTLERLYPKYDGFESALTPQDTHWVRYRGKDSIYIMTRYERIKESQKASLWINPMTGNSETFYDEDIELIKDDLKLEGFEFRREKKVIRHTVERCLMDGKGFIEEPAVVAGKYLPIIPVYAYRGYIDGREYYYGLIRKAKDPQRLINMNVSNLAEISSTDDSAVPVVDPESIEGYEKEWSGDRSKKSYLQKRRFKTQKDGTQVDLGPVEYLTGRTINDATLKLMDFTSGHLREKSGEMLFEGLKSEMSGAAIRQVMARMNMKTRPIFGNITTATRREGMIYQSIASEIYVNPRKVKILQADGSESMVKLNQRIVDNKTGLVTTINNIAKMKFEVVVETGDSYDTMREETTDTLRSLMSEIGPEHEYYDICLYMLIQVIGGVDLDTLKEYNRKQMLIRGIIEPNEDDPEELQIVENSRNQTDPQDELAKAATEQQKAEAENLMASSKQKLSDAGLKEAQKMKTLTQIGVDRDKLNMEKIAGFEKLADAARPIQ